MAVWLLDQPISIRFSLQATNYLSLRPRLGAANTGLKEVFFMQLQL
jgi:hypothetical protein